MWLWLEWENYIYEGEWVEGTILVYMRNEIKQLKKAIQEGEKLLQQAKIASAYLEGYRDGLEEAKRINGSLGYAMGVLMNLATHREG